MRFEKNGFAILKIKLGDDLRAQALRPVTWDEWIALPIRPQDNAVQTVRCAIGWKALSRRNGCRPVDLCVALRP